jgi:DNA polymerase phi
MGENPLKRERENQATVSAVRSKRRRQSQVVDPQLRKLYNDLAAEEDETRLEAAKQIILHFSPEKAPSAPSVHQARDRLIRGLCSSRKAARFGFCVTLTELLRSLFGQDQDKVQALGLSVNGVIDEVVERTQVEGNVPGNVGGLNLEVGFSSQSLQERRDHKIGRLFGYKAIMQSGILLEPSLSLDCWSKVLDHIYGMARKVPWLREECGLIVVEAIKNLGSKEDFRSCAQEAVQRLVSSGLANTPGGWRSGLQ